MNNNQKGLTFAILSVFLWSTVATAFKINLKYFDVYNMLFFSSFTSFLFFLILKFSHKSNQKFSLNNYGIIKSAIYGLLNPFLYYLVLFSAYKKLPAQIAQPLNYSWVIVLSILSVIFLKQKISLNSFIGIIISFFGIIIISNTQNLNQSIELDILGIFLAISSSLIWGMYWVLNLKDNRDIIDKLLFNFLFGTIYSLIPLIIKKNISLNLFGILSSIYVGLFEMGLTFYTWMLALKYSNNSAKVGNIIFLSPVISLFLISFILKEEILISSIIGLLLIISGILIQRIKN